MHDAHANVSENVSDRSIHGCLSLTVPRPYPWNTFSLVALMWFH